MTPNKQSGYIAIVGTVILSIVLLAVTLTVSSSGFFSRENILKSEFKERSLALAEACISTALLKLSQNPSYAGNENINLGGDACSILPIETSVGQKTIKTKAIFQKSVTNLKLIVKDTDLSLLSWEETPNF